MYCIGQLDITNRVWLLLDLAGHAFVALAALAHRPFRRFVRANFFFPFRTDFRKIIGEDERRAAAISPMNYRDVRRRQTHPGVVLLDELVVPLFDLAEEDVGDDFRRKVQGLGN